MKTVLKTAAAALALIGSAGVAHADPISSITVGTVGPSFPLNLIPTGAVYSQIGGSLGNTETASPTVTNTFTLTGTVAKDCSYYGGSSTSHTVAFGTIGVVTGNNVNVNNLFDMNAPALVNINTTTAGCNFNNTVTITKANGVNGMVNTTASGFDSSEFQNNIPYNINANWQGTTNTSAGAVGTGQSLTVSTSEGTDQWTGGAWRSGFNMLVTLPTPSKGLVAGNYQDTITLELKAL